jgi:hypothetical protein
MGNQRLTIPESIELFDALKFDGYFDRIFAASVSALQPKKLLDLSVIHGDGTTTAAKKGGDNLGFSGRKHMKGDKVVAFCDRNYNVNAPLCYSPWQS